MIRYAPGPVYHGPTPYSGDPVVVFSVAWSGLPPDSDVVEEACGAMRARWPSWLGHPPQDQVSSEPLALLADTAARWALALLNDGSGCLRAAGAAETETAGTLRVWLGFHAHQVSGAALELALQTMNALLHSTRYDLTILERPLAELSALCRRHHPDSQARILMAGARAKNIPFLPLVPGTPYWQFGWGQRSRKFFWSSSDTDSMVAGQLQRNKALSKQLFYALSIPTPPAAVVTRPEELEQAREQIGWPCVVKPLFSYGGQGVTAGINDGEELRRAFLHARRASNEPVLVEAHLSGEDHRLMVIEGKLVAAIRRQASRVMGDGRRNLSQLIDEINRSRSTGKPGERVLSLIDKNGMLSEHLARQNLTLESVPEAGREVTLQSVSNRSSGGTAKDVTDQIHPQVRRMAEQLAQTTGLGCAGVDYLTTDITQTPEASGGMFIEINATPGLIVCVAAGWSRERIARLVLGDRPGRIPLSLTLCSPQEGQGIFQSSRQNLQKGAGCLYVPLFQLGPVTYRTGEVPLWSAVQSALRNQALEELHIIASIEDIVAEGLPADHFGQVKLCGVRLPRTWSEVVERHATKVDLD